MWKNMEINILNTKHIIKSTPEVKSIYKRPSIQKIYVESYSVLLLAGFLWVRGFLWSGFFMGRIYFYRLIFFIVNFMYKSGYKIFFSLDKLFISRLSSEINASEVLLYPALSTFSC